MTTVAADELVALLQAATRIPSVTPDEGDFARLGPHAGIVGAAAAR